MPSIAVSSDSETLPAAHAVQWDAAAYAANSKVQLSWARELIEQMQLQGH